MMKIFQKIGGLFPRRSRFNLSYTKKFSADMGKIYPVLCEEVVPGDTWKIGNNIVIRFQPLVAPILHNINVKVHYFFVPYRILWSKLHNDEMNLPLDGSWEDFIAGVNDPLPESGGAVTPEEDEPILPRFYPVTGTSYDSSGAISAKKSLWDFFGMNVGVTTDAEEVPTHQSAEKDNFPLLFPWLAYNMIYNEYYRDENLIEPVELDQGAVLNCCWNKDYFTSALPWQQRGIAPALPISGYGVAEFTGNFLQMGDAQSPDLGRSNSITRYIRGRTGQSFVPPLEPELGTPFVFQPYNDYLQELGNYSNDTDDQARMSENFNINMRNALNHNRVALDNVNTFDISDLRLAFQVQKWLERNARGGVRYTEFLKAHFGVSPRDDRLQRPEYIGGSKSPVVISEVLQTSSTDSTSPQGNLAGHGLVADGNFCSSYTATEYGLVMGLMTVVPDTEYQQGINRQWLRKTKYDFYSPEFAHLSEQAVEEGEIYFTGDPTNDKKIFGYQGRFDEMRVKQNMTCSEMRDTFDYWHLGRKFVSAPNLNGDFVTCKPSKRIFAVQDEDTLIVSFHNRVKAIRPLPLIGEPGLIDHN